MHRNDHAVLPCIGLKTHLDDEMFGLTFVLSILLLAGWCVVAVLVSRSVIRATEITGDSIVLESVSSEFATAVRSARKQSDALEPVETYDPYPR